MVDFWLCIIQLFIRDEAVSVVLVVSEHKPHTRTDPVWIRILNPQILGQAVCRPEGSPNSAGSQEIWIVL